MLKRYTRRQMLDYWKRRLGLGPLEMQDSVTDYTSIDDLLLADIDIWYSSLLHTGDPNLLPTRDFGGSVMGIWLDESSVLIRFPKEGSRFLSLRMAGWDFPLLRLEEADSEIARRQRSPYLRAGISSPVGIRISGGVIVYGVDSKGNGGNQVHELIMTCGPSNGSYELDPLLLQSAKLSNFE